MFEYRIKGFSIPVQVESFRLSEVEAIKPLIVQLEIHDSVVKRRIIVHKIGVVLRGVGLIQENARVVGISMGYMANGERRVFVAVYLKEGINDLTGQRIGDQTILGAK